MANFFGGLFFLLALIFLHGWVHENIFRMSLNSLVHLTQERQILTAIIGHVYPTHEVKKEVVLYTQEEGKAELFAVFTGNGEKDAFSMCQSVLAQIETLDGSCVERDQEQ